MENWCITRAILNWTEKKTEEIDVENDKHPYLKAVGLGAIEGLIDAAVIVYPFTVAALFYAVRQKNKNV